MFKILLLPQPEGPMIDTTSPLLTVKLGSRTATSGSPPLRRAKRLVTLRNSISIMKILQGRPNLFHT